MNSFEKLLFVLQEEMIRPKAFGCFHIFCLIIVAILIFVLYKRKKHYNDTQLKTVLGIYGVIALILEVLKQLIWAFNYDALTNAVYWDFEWYSFPFQLCTTPIYVSLICLFLNKNKIRNYLLSYLAYITIWGSMSTMILPDSCFTSDILVNIHTMWLHLGSFVVSIYLFISGEVRVNLKSLKDAFYIFLMFVGIALCMNIYIYNTGILNGETFNMFYISPYFISELPVFNIIQENVPYIPFLIIYIFALMIGGFIIYGCAKLASNFSQKQ